MQAEALAEAISASVADEPIRLLDESYLINRLYSGLEPIPEPNWANRYNTGSETEVRTGHPQLQNREQESTTTSTVPTIITATTTGSPSSDAQQPATTSPATDAEQPTSSTNPTNMMLGETRRERERQERHTRIRNNSRSDAAHSTLGLEKTTCTQPLYGRVSGTNVGFALVEVQLLRLHECNGTAGGRHIWMDDKEILQPANPNATDHPTMFTTGDYVMFHGETQTGEFDGYYRAVKVNVVDEATMRTDPRIAEQETLVQNGGTMYGSMGTLDVNIINNQRQSSKHAQNKN